MPTGPKGQKRPADVTEISPAEKRRRTQWATQFLAAAELTRRGYTVAFTTGNHTPVADLMVGAPDGTLFWVDVKGLAGKNDWLVKPKAIREQMFYVLVLLSCLVEGGDSRRADRFFILTQAEANTLEAQYRADRPNNKTTIPGFGFKSAENHEDKWDKLPGGAVAAESYN